MHEHWLNTAGDCKVDLLEKKNSSYLAAEEDESLPWAAFLTPPCPNNALID